MTAELKKTGKPSAAVRAQAAAWVARLHGPNRTEEVEAGLRRWLAEAPEHAAAFELLTDTWEKSARLRRRPMERVASWQAVGFRLSFSRAALATMAVAALAVLGTIFYLHSDAVVTAVGEQRTLTLEDGTRVYLNTDSRAVVHYGKQLRRVELEKGEALFEVAKRPDWPFIVTAGDRQVRALGTAFIVRRDNQNVAVTLMEGKVTVSPVTRTPSGALEGQGDVAPQRKRSLETTSAQTLKPQKTSESDSDAVFTLSPGQRLTFASSEPPKFDRPPLERVTAWQRGQVAFDDTPLVDAAAEMNRYSTVRVVVEDPSAAAIRVSGIFRAGDSANFAQAVARTYRLQVRDQADEVILAGTGAQPATP
jgi:transmembrane sensor